MHRSITLTAVLAALVVTVALASCGGDDDGAIETLPPIRTTTSAPTTTSTTISADRQFYEIKSGETLSIIARRFEVPLTAIIELNGLANPDDIQAGQVIEIPTGVVLVTELPEPAAETSAP